MSELLSIDGIEYERVEMDDFSCYGCAFESGGCVKDIRIQCIRSDGTLCMFKKLTEEKR